MGQFQDELAALKLPPKTEREIRDSINNGDKMNAICLLKNNCEGFGLKAAKELIFAIPVEPTIENGGIPMPEHLFRCVCCDKVLPKVEKSSAYKVDICKACANSLHQYDGHLVYSKSDGVKQTMSHICVLCGNSEDWVSAEHQGQLLKNIPCCK